MLRTRFGAALVAGLVALLSLGASSVSAAGVTRYVDDDGLASARGCDAGATAFSTIQAAVNASHSGDTVAVCPGTFQEQVKITASRQNLTLRTVDAFTARILSPTTLTADRSLISVRAWGAIIQGFKIVALALPSGCEQVFAGVLVHPQASAVVRGNRFYTAGGDTLGPCGYIAGVVAGIESIDSQVPLTQGAKVNVLWNVIKDFQIAGAVVLGPLSRGRIDQNSIQYLHGGTSPFSSASPTAADLRRLSGQQPGPTGCISARSGTPDAITRAPARFGRSLAADPAGDGRSTGSGDGIAFANDAYGVPYRNNIYSSMPGQCGGPILRYGVLMFGSAATMSLDPIAPFGQTSIGDNLVYGAYAGYLLQGVSGVTMTGDRSLASVYGVIVSADGNTIAKHTARLGEIGIQVLSGSAGNTVRDSDFRGQSSVDCYDETTGSGTGGTANDWIDDLGDDANRPDICIPGVVVP